MKYNVILTAIVSLCYFAIQAQQTKVLTLKQAIDLGVQNNKQLRANKAQIDFAAASYQEALDNRLPDFKISGSYLRIVSSNVDVKLKSNNTTSGGGASSSPNVNQALYGIANLSYPLYAGGRIKYGIESAKYLQQATVLDADNNKEAVIFNTIDAFANLYKAKTAITLVKENLAASQQRDSMFANLERNGLLARNDLLKSELQTSNIELNLLQAQTNWNLANVNMDLMLGLPENTEIIQDSAGALVPVSLKSFEEYENLALQNRIDVQALSLREKAAVTGIKSAKATAYPTVVLTGGYIAAYVPNIITITNAVNVGVGVQYNLASLWKKNTKLLQAQAREEELKANEDQLSDAIRLQVNRDYQNYLLTQKKIEVYTKAVYQATENYRITKNKYDNSLVTITDLLDADAAQLQAKLGVTSARIDAQVAYNKLLLTAGLLVQ